MRHDQNRRIRLSRHAREKFETLKRYGFEISEEEVIKAIQNPERVDKRGTQYLTIRAIDEKHALKVVYEEEKRSSTSHNLLSCEEEALWRIRSSTTRRPTCSQ